MYTFSVNSNIQNYDVKFINNSNNIIKNIVNSGDVFIIDNKILDFYPDIIKNIDSKNLVINIEATEEQKSYEGVIPIINLLIENGFKKNHKLIGIGGGITQDITGFISSVIYRGVNWIFFPTTLLAQGDSCIGSKTSINFKGYKNQIGGFYPPKKIYINLNYLDTLDKIDLMSGLGEMCHYFIVASEKEFHYFENNYIDAITKKDTLSSIIHRSLNIKKSYIELDEFDLNKRQVFNYGHSFGHAIESLTNFNIPHGIAVSYGMDIANYVSMKMGILDNQIRDRIRSVLKNIWIGFDLKGIDSDLFMSLLEKDKKNFDKNINLILCKGIGQVFKTAIENKNNLHKWLNNYLRQEV
jgi:3-dehydroquinate synthase